MLAQPQDLARALDHAPAVVLIEAERADHAMHAASACIAGGHRIYAVSAWTPDHLDLLRALTPRHDALVGTAFVPDAEAARAALAAGASFVLGADVDPSVGGACAEAGALWIPGVMTPGELREALAAGATMVQLYPAATCGGPVHLRQLLRAYPQASVLAGGGIGGDTIGDWMEAGARGVVLSEAIYSPALLAAGERMQVRARAAATHKETTRWSRVTQGTA